MFLFKVVALDGKDLYVIRVFHIRDANTVAVSISHGNVSVTETGEAFSVIKVRFNTILKYLSQGSNDQI